MTKSNGKRCWIAAGAGFGVLNLMEFCWHHFVLGGTYKSASFAGLWNSEAVMNSRMWAMFVAFGVSAILFTTIYAKGFEPAKPALGQGVRCGFLLGAFLGLYFGLINFFIFPVSLGLALAWSATLLFDYIILGAVVSLIYKPQPQ